MSEFPEVQRLVDDISLQASQNNVRLILEDAPKVNYPTGGSEAPSPVTIEHPSKFSQRWIDYLGSLGGHVLKWSAALQGSYTPGIVMFKNPGETPWELASMIASPTYILLTDEVAMKILVLGELP